METKQVADLTGVTGDTIRRWTSDEYTAFLSPGATPAKGADRRFNEHDLRVLNYVSTARDTGTPHDQIRSALAKMRENGWSELPPIPDEWTQPPADGRIAIHEAGERAQDIARITALEVQVVNLRERLEEATERAEKAERELDHARATKDADTAQIHDLELKLKDAAGEVRELQARLSAYAVAGGDRPVPVLAIIVAALLVGALLVALSFVLARVLL